MGKIGVGFLRFVCEVAPRLHKLGVLRALVIVLKLRKPLISGFITSGPTVGMVVSGGVPGEEQAEEILKLVWLLFNAGGLKLLLYVGVGCMIMPLRVLKYRCS